MKASLDSLSETHRLDQLPSFPPALLGLMRQFQSPEPDPGEVESLVEQDSAISLRLLAVSASPVFNRSGSPRSVAEAIRLLGLDTVQALSLTAGIIQFFQHLEGGERSWWTPYWQHSLACSMGAGLLAREFGRGASVEEARLAGLLHDIGRPLLATLYPDSMEELTREFGWSSPALQEEERQRFGHSHDEVGTAMLARCGLPDSLVDAIRYHHYPVDAIRDAQPLVRIVHVANAMANSGLEPDAGTLYASAELLDLGRSLTARLHRQAQEDAARLAAALAETGARPDARLAGDSFTVWQPLAEGIRAQALLGAVQNQLQAWPDHDAIQGIERALLILFGLEGVVCFQLDSDSRELRRCPGGRLAEDLEGVSLPLVAERSVLARTVLEARPLHTLDPELTRTLPVIDRQLIQRLGGDSMLCLPLHWQEQPQGVLALGIRETQISAVLDLSPLLLAFAGEVARVVARLRNEQRRQEEQQADKTARVEQELGSISQAVADPLTVIRNYLHVLKSELSSDHPSLERVDRIGDEVERVSELLQRMGNDDPLAGDAKPDE
ncbi:MAG: HDOD domain-containing protein [Ectothiorhodospiraceae bacterium]|nr:HDOD domain-containing protein [Ectothiorhodospiraceae bacterium]